MANEIERWLNRICQHENPPETIQAYNIGLFEAPNGYKAYLMGAEVFDERNSDWACREDFTPKDRYCTIAKSKKKDWQEIHSLAVAAVSDFLNSPEGRQSFLTQAVAITVGFDDGELERVR